METSDWLYVTPDGKLNVPSYKFYGLSNSETPLDRKITKKFSKWAPVIGFKERKHYLGYLVVGVLTDKKKKK
jgi:hypothetical protein